MIYTDFLKNFYIRSLILITLKAGRSLFLMYSNIIHERERERERERESVFII